MRGFRRSRKGGHIRRGFEEIQFHPARYIYKTMDRYDV
jgi:hypothetical protein